MKNIKVVAAIICREQEFLCMQRCRSVYDYESKMWEFPGGKVEDDESETEALQREIKEEMDWDITVNRHLATVEYSYPHCHISLSAYLCSPGHGEFIMLNHLDYKWLSKENLDTLQWMAADRLLVRILQNEEATVHLND